MELIAKLKKDNALNCLMNHLDRGCRGRLAQAIDALRVNKEETLVEEKKAKQIEMEEIRV